MRSLRWPCIIPARSGSKRVPNKNMLTFGDSTLLGNCIKKAIESNTFSEVIISTDSSDYEEYAVSCGAITYGLRPPALSSDKSSTTDLIVYFLNDVLPQRTEGFTLLQCTSPFTQIKTIQSVTNLSRANLGSCISVKEMPSIYAEWIYKDVNGRVVSLINSKDYFRSQDCTPILLPTGNVYSSTREHYLKHKSFLNTERSFFYKIADDEEFLDIDTHEDYKAAILKLNR